MLSTFLKKKYFFWILMISYFFIACGGAQKSGDEKLFTVYDINNMIQI